MDKGDDIYLLRLVATTETVDGSAVAELDAETSNKVLKKINRIVRRGVFEEFAVAGRAKCGQLYQIAHELLGYPEPPRALMRETETARRSARMPLASIT